MKSFYSLVLFCSLVALSSAAFGESHLVFMVEEGESKQIGISNSEGKESQLITSGKLWNLYPDIDGSGKMVTYVQLDPATSPPNAKIMLHSLKTGKTQTLIEKRGQYLHPDLSGDGRHLAFSGPLGPQGRIQIGYLKLNDDEKRPKVVSTEHPAYFPSFSSDGAFIIFQLNLSKTQKQVVRYDIEEKKLTPITEESELTMAPSLSFDDRKVVYTKRVEGIWNIYISDLLSKKTIQVTDTKSRDFAPTFRPDGGIVFASDRDGHFELYEIPIEEIIAKSYGTRELIKGDASYYAPAVSGTVGYSQKVMPPIRKPARSSFGAVKVGNRVYVVGGHQGREHTYPPESFLAKVEYFDLGTGKWHEVAPRLNPCHGFELAVNGKYIYAFGGFAYSKDHKPKWKSLSVVERYDTENDKWEAIGEMPRRRSSNVVAQLDGKAYLIAGWDSTPKHENDYDGKFHREIDVFDFKTETFTTLKHKLPDPLRRALSAEVVGDEIILIGGLGQGATHFELLDHVTAFDPKTGDWRELPKLPFATFAPAAGVMGNDLYVFGGMFKTGPMNYVYVNHAYSLPWRAKQWTHTGRYVSEPKGFAQVLNLSKDSLGILGGHSYEGGDAPVATFEVFSRK